MDSAKYQSDIIHDIEIVCECVVFPQKGNIFIHDIAPCQNSKSTRKFQECKGIPVLEGQGNWRDKNTRERLEYNEEIGNQMPCRREEIWKPVCEEWYSVAPNVLENLTIQCQEELQILLKQREIQKILTL